MNHTATYSPEDNKIRIYPAARLDPETYARVKEAGYAWAPKQQIFVAPMWTPGRADLAVELCGEIGDEDKSLVERAEERAERFEDYSEKRADDAHRAKEGVQALTDNIPFGQPILVGHHSEKRARKDAERIEQGLKRAVQLWETSEYWTRRAAGAIRSAKYKERSDVRARRIKGLEADLRKQEKNRKEAEFFLIHWSSPDMTHEKAVKISGADYTYHSFCFPLADYPRQPPASQYEGQMSVYSALIGGVIDHLTAARLSADAQAAAIARATRWIDHLKNRLAYERAMLAEGGGLKADGIEFEVGGQVRHSYGWNIIKKVNKKEGRVVSLSLITTKYPSIVQVEDIKEYKAPEAGATEAVKAATKAPPLCNYPGEGFFHMTNAEYKEKGMWARSVDIIKDPTPHRVYTISNRIAKPAGKSEWGSTPVFFTDQKRKDPLALTVKAEPVNLPEVPQEPRRIYQPREKSAEAQEFDAIKDTLKGGVQTVTAPQLFPTPREIAADMALLLCVEPGQRILEPSAGTGALLGALGGKMFGPDADAWRGQVHAVEINARLADRLRSEFPLTTVTCVDFLTLSADDLGGEFDRVIMNPPFENGIDIKHIRHAFAMLKPGGHLVALCANGSRQQTAFKDIAEHWEDLPAGSFKAQGTNVNVALFVLRKEG